MGLLDELFKNAESGRLVREKVELHPSVLRQRLMTSQFAAFFLEERDSAYLTEYVKRLEGIGIDANNAAKMFDFECGILRQYRKPYLLHHQFTQMWLFGLEKPLFRQYPKEKRDILKELSLTVSELCKLIDEAEWHFWNSHEQDLSLEVWGEICAWRLKGAGGDFALRYFEKIASETGLSEMQLARLSSAQGRHLSQYKWNRMQAY